MPRKKAIDNGQMTLGLDIEAIPTAPKKKRVSKKKEALVSEPITYDHSDVIFNTDAAIEALKDCRYIGFDLETGGLNPIRDPIAVISMCGDNGVTAILHLRGHIPNNLRTFLEDPSRMYIIHNGTAFDVPFLVANDIRIKNWFDTLTIEALAQTSGRKDISKSLKDTIARRLKKEIPKSIGDHSWMKKTLTDEEIQYCRDDVEYLVDLMHALIKRVKDSGQIKALELELSIAPIVTEMTVNGLPINLELLKEYLDKQATLAAVNREKIVNVWGEFNLDSHAQLKKAYNLAGVQLPMVKNPKGELVQSTKISALEELHASHEDPAIREITGWIIDYRYGNQRVKMYRTWLDPNNDKNPVYKGRVRARYWQTGTGTLRFSSSEPNMQQIPVDMRHVFGHLEGHTIVAIDYSAIEALVAGAQAKDRAFLQAFIESDPHSAVGSRLFQKSASEITKDERQQSKAGTFCLIFGGGPKTLQVYARMYGQYLTLNECREIEASFFNAFPGLRAMRARARDQSNEKPNGPLVVRLPSGAMRVLVGNDAKSTSLLNTSIQGTAAAGMKHALRLAWEKGLGPYIGATVHDELVACVPDELVDWYIEQVTECMIEGMYCVVPKSIFIEGEHVLVPVKVGVTKGVFWSK